MPTGSPTRRELAALMQSSRRRHRNLDGTERWPLRRLLHELKLAQAGDVRVVDPAILAAVASARAKGATTTAWSRATLYAAEAHGATTPPRPGRDMVMMYDELFNEGKPYLLSYWEQVRLASPSPSQGSRARATRYPLPGDRVDFLCDLNVPDSVVVPPNHRFVKRWRVLNSGTELWHNRRLLRLGPPTGFGIARSEPSVLVPTTKAGETVDLAVDVTSPTIETTHCEPRWKIADQEGEFCFPDLSYGVGIVMSVVEGAPVPDMEIPNAESVAAMKLVWLQNRGDRPPSR